MSRIAARFADLRAQDRAAFIPFITAGDPDAETSFAILEQLPAAGADIIELGVPFSDPMADGPVIQASSSRALRAGMTVKGTLDLVRRFRAKNATTPIVLMGYFNPIHAYGTDAFVRDAQSAGVDGLIIVDLGPEEDSELRALASRVSIDIVRLVTPTTDDERLAAILDGAGGFLYYVSVAGVTGTKTFTAGDVKTAVERIRRSSGLPCAVGFGIRTKDEAATIARIADAAVVGSAMVARIAAAQVEWKPPSAIVEDALSLCGSLANAVHGAREAARPQATITPRSV